MYKHILAQHNIWRLQEMLKSYLKPWEVFYTGLKEPKCSLLTLFCALTLNVWLQRETHKVPNCHFLYRCPWRKSSHQLFFMLQCHVRHLFCLQSSFLLPSPMVLKLKRKCTGRSLHCYPPPSTSTSTKRSPPGIQWSKYCIVFIGTCDPPESPGYLWSLWAQQDTGLPCKALEIPWGDFVPHSTPPYCGLHQVPGSGNWCNTLFYSRRSGECIELQSCTLETAGELPSRCRDTHSRSF